VADPEQYCKNIENGHSTITESEELEPEASFRESVIMGLRMSQGVALDRLRARYGIDIVEYYGNILDNLIAQQLLELTPSHLRVTEKGRMLSNSILAELV
jgi:oxygen-independent coproporphyrinogen-3 oxidase